MSGNKCISDFNSGHSKLKSRKNDSRCYETPNFNIFNAYNNIIIINAHYII